MTGLSIYYHDGKTLIYYVARYLPSSDDRVHCMVQQIDGTWNTISPSYSAAYASGTSVSVQRKPITTSDLAVSADGNTIAYIGIDSCVYMYFNINDVIYTYVGVLNTNVTAFGNNSLQFTPDKLVYYICNYTFHFWSPSPGRFLDFSLAPAAPILSVQYFKYQNNYCQNRNISSYESL